MQNEDTGSSSTPLDSHIRTRPFTTIDRLKGLPGYYFTPPTSGSVTPASIPPTPPLNEDANGRLSRAIMSFENLVALANHQERIKGAKKMVWRDKGQPVVELDTFKRCLTHALSGGLRSGTLALVIRACLNLILVLRRFRRIPRERRLAEILLIVFGTDTWRFAAMLGTFTSLYKFLINALPILIPAINPKQNSSASALDEGHAHPRDASTGGERLSLTTRTQLILIRKKTRRWHAALAGGIAGGLAIMWEKRGRRTFIGQQMFVRGLQGSWNAFATKRNIHVPHGEVIIFALASAQILYAYLLRRDTLPESYLIWLRQASKVPEEGVRINRDLVRHGIFNVKDVDDLMCSANTTPSNKTALLSFRDTFLGKSPAEGSAYLPRYVPCCAVHPSVTSCRSVPLDRFITVSKWILPIYGALHFIPALMFRRKAFAQHPFKEFVKTGLGSLRSSAFLGAFVTIYQALFCFKHNVHQFLTLRRTGAVPTSFLSSPLKRIPQWVIDLLISRPSFAVPGLATGLSLFVEEKRRRGELAMYVLPKGLESAWVMARGKGWVFRTGKWGETLLTAIGMAMVMSTYQNDPQHLSSLFRRILYQFIGPN